MSGQPPAPHGVGGPRGEAVRSGARVMWWGRAGLMLFAVAQLAVYEPLTPGTAPSWLVPAGLGLVGFLGATTLVSCAVVRRAATLAALRRLATVEVFADLGAMTGYVLLFTHEAQTALWTLLLLPVLEGAWRLGAPSAAVTGAGAALVAVLHASVATFVLPGVDVPTHSITFRGGVIASVTAVGVLLARQHHRAVRASEAERHRVAEQSARLRAVVDAHRVSADRPPEEALEAIVDGAVAVGFHSGALVRLDPAVGPRIAVATGAEQHADGRAARALAERVAAALPDDGSTASTSSTPLSTPWGRLHVVAAGSRALLAGITRPGEEVEEVQFECLQLLGAQAGAVLEQLGKQREHERLEQELSHQASHDFLTDLPNRSAFLSHLQHALAAGDDVAVLFLDLDGFKLLNDTLGHEVGDDLLCAAALRLQTSLRDIDVVARFGGDEFTIMLRGLRSPDDALHLASRVQDVLGEPFDLDGHRAYVSASIGITIGHPGDDPQELIRDADLAMYEAKREGRGGVSCFSAVMGERLRRRRDVENELPAAFERGELRVAYQPMIDVATKRIVGAEALLRWEHPEWGAVSPAEFVPVAEESGFLRTLGRWVLREATAAAARWPAVDGQRPFVAVNLGAREVRHPEAGQELRAALSAAGLPGERLVLEVTESAIVDRDSAAPLLEAASELGVKLAMDDFGQGLSSLSRLRQLPLDMLKLDRAFISELDDSGADRAIVQAVTALAHHLGMVVVAEGIETEGQETAVLRLGCDLGQGFRYDPALTETELRRRLERRLVAV